MKQQIILWTAAIILTFLVIYMGNRTGGYYPLSGTIGINDQKVTFMFDKIYRGNKDYKVTIRNDVKGAEGFLLWKKGPDAEFTRVTMKDSAGVLFAYIPAQKPYSQIYYRCEIVKDGRHYYFPVDRDADMVILGGVPPTVMNLFYFFLYGGILLSIRGALEFFNENKKAKVYAMFTSIFFFCYTIAVTPLKTTYEMNAISMHSVPSIDKLFNLQAVLLLIVWIIGMVMVIGKKNPGIRMIIFSVITVLLFLLMPLRY